MGLLAVLRYPIEGYLEPKEVERIYRENVRRYGKKPAQWHLTLQRQQAQRSACAFGTTSCLVTFAALATPYGPILAPLAAFTGLLARDQARYSQHMSRMLQMAQAGSNPAPFDPTIRNGFYPPAALPPAPRPTRSL